MQNLMVRCGAREGRFKGVVRSRRGRDTGPRTRPQGLTSHIGYRGLFLTSCGCTPQKRGWGWMVRVLRNLILRLFPKRISVMNPSGRFFSPGHNVCLPVTHAHVFARMPYAVRRYGQISCGESFACHTGKLLLISQSVTHSLSQSPTHSPSQSLKHKFLHFFYKQVPPLFGRNSGRWMGYMYRIRTISSGSVPAGRPVIFGGSRA